MDYNINPTLSIIVPVYNTQLYLEKCLCSVENAVRGIENIIEVLIINDGSTDNSQLIIDKFCENNIYMKCFNKNNGGLSDVKNYGLKYARGEFVVFLDSDDYIEPDMYKEMLKKLIDENADIAVCDIRLTYDDQNLNTIYPCAVTCREDTFSQVIDMSMMPASWNKIVRKTLYADLEFPVGFNNEDVAVTPIILARAKKIVILNKAYYNYYQRVGSIQNSCFDEKRFVILQTAQLCLDRLAGIEDAKQEKIKGSLFMHQILSIALYPIRAEKFFRRYSLLKKYMEEVYSLFPYIWDNGEVLESLTWEGIYMQTFRKGSRFFLKHRCYLLTCIFWSVANAAHKLLEYIRGI